MSQSFCKLIFLVLSVTFVSVAQIKKYRVNSNAFQKDLGVAGNVGEGSIVKLVNGNDIWEFDWNQAQNTNSGATIKYSRQDGGRIKVIDEDVGSGKVATWGDAGQRNQKWYLRRVNTDVYQVVNLATNRCLHISDQNAQVSTVSCISGVNQNQNWMIKEQTTEDFVQVSVNEHNKYRSLHNTPGVASFSSDINGFAQRWADHLASTDKFEHSGGPYGENLYKSWGGSSEKNQIMRDAIAAFYGEIKNYDWNNPGFSSATGHFTQLVWKSSTEIGVGVSVYPDAQWGVRTVVCINYRPPGNVGGQYPQNVLRPTATFNNVLEDLNTTLSSSCQPGTCKSMVL